MWGIPKTERACGLKLVAASPFSLWLISQGRVASCGERSVLCGHETFWARDASLLRLRSYPNEETRGNAHRSLNAQAYMNGRT